MPAYAPKGFGHATYLHNPLFTPHFPRPCLHAHERACRRKGEDSRIIQTPVSTFSSWERSFRGNEARLLPKLKVKLSCCSDWCDFSLTCILCKLVAWWITREHLARADAAMHGKVTHVRSVWVSRSGLFCVRLRC